MRYRPQELRPQSPRHLHPKVRGLTLHNLSESYSIIYNLGKMSDKTITMNGLDILMRSMMKDLARSDEVKERTVQLNKRMGCVTGCVKNCETKIKRVEDKVAAHGDQIEELRRELDQLKAEGAPTRGAAASATDEPASIGRREAWPFRRAVAVWRLGTPPYRAKRFDPRVLPPCLRPACPPPSLLAHVASPKVVHDLGVGL